MIVSRIALKNWRNFLNVDVPLGQRVFLVGPNASGKSNFMDALRFLRDIAKPKGGGLKQAVEDRNGISKIRCLAAGRHPNIEIEIELSNSPGKPASWKYAIGIKQESRGARQPYLAYERVWRGTEKILARPGPEDDKDKMRLTQTHLEQINANADFREIAKFLESALYFHIIPQLLRYPHAFSGPGLPGDPFGLNFLERVAKTPPKTRRARLRKIEAALRLAVPQMKELADVQDETGATHLEAVYEHWRARGAKQREDQFSDGTLRLLGLLWALQESNALMLLEEPELSLNSAIIRKLPALVHRLQRYTGSQVILSTHSADLVSDKGIGPEEVLLLEPTGQKGTKVEPVLHIEEVKRLLESGLSIAEAVLPRTNPPQAEQLHLFQ
ncbi:MAG: AAA family ATPase [Elusimicrobia bacterium]|nr:AAA family ATPase [Elusimicrobiota bacterium]